MKYVDPDGRLIRIDDEGDSTFKSDVIQSIEYLKKTEIGKKFIEELEKSETTTFTIKQCSWLNDKLTAEGGDFYDPDNNTIYWNGRATLMAANGKYNSPAICLMHEFVHAVVDETKYGQEKFAQYCTIYKQDLMKDMYYKPNEEFATYVEKCVAKQLGECSGRKYYNNLCWVPNKQNPTCFYAVKVFVTSPLNHSGMYN